MTSKKTLEYIAGGDQSSSSKTIPFILLLFTFYYGGCDFFSVDVVNAYISVLYYGYFGIWLVVVRSSTITYYVSYGFGGY